MICCGACIAICPSGCATGTVWGRECVQPAWQVLLLPTGASLAALMQTVVSEQSTSNVRDEEQHNSVCVDPVPSALVSALQARAHPTAGPARAFKEHCYTLKQYTSPPWGATRWHHSKAQRREETLWSRDGYPDLVGFHLKRPFDIGTRASGTLGPTQHLGVAQRSGSSCNGPQLRHHVGSRPETITR